MKKYFSLASALMLALSMGMTSCSNDLDEVQAPVEQQPQLHKLHLTASVPQSSETRSYVEGVGDGDAIKITGWRDGDVIYGIYPVIEDDFGSMKTGTLGRLAFEFNGTTKEFESDLTGFNAEDIRYFIYGDFDFTKGYGGGYHYDSYSGEDLYQYFYLNDPDNPLQIDVAGNSSKIPMWGKASVQAGQLTTDMKLADGMALLCVHNDSEAPIEVRLGYRYSTSNGTVYSYYYTIPYLGFEANDDPGDEYCKYFLQTDQDRAKAAYTTIPKGEKAYIPVRTLSHISYEVKVMINEQTHDNAIKSKVENTFVAGKVYKLIYPGS